MNKLINKLILNENVDDEIKQLCKQFSDEYQDKIADQVTKWDNSKVYSFENYFNTKNFKLIDWSALKNLTSNVQDEYILIEIFIILFRETNKLPIYCFDDCKDALVDIINEMGFDYKVNIILWFFKSFYEKHPQNKFKFTNNKVNILINAWANRWLQPDEITGMSDKTLIAYFISLWSKADSDIVNILKLYNDDYEIKTLNPDAIIKELGFSDSIKSTLRSIKAIDSNNRVDNEDEFKKIIFFTCDDNNSYLKIKEVRNYSIINRLFSVGKAIKQNNDRLATKDQQYDRLQKSMSDLKSQKQQQRVDTLFKLKKAGVINKDILADLNYVLNKNDNSTK